MRVTTRQDSANSSEGRMVAGRHPRQHIAFWSVCATAGPGECGWINIRQIEASAGAMTRYASGARSGSGSSPTNGSPMRPAETRMGLR